MNNASTLSRANRGWLAAGLLVASSALTGCQLDVAGQTLPSPHYLQDDVQYFPAGPEFKLAREAAALKEASEANKAAGAKNHRL